MKFEKLTTTIFAKGMIKIEDSQPVQHILDAGRSIKSKISLPFIKSKKIGKNTYLDKSVQILGWRNVVIGENSILSEGTWININHRESREISVSIGNNCFIGRRNFFTAGKLIRIGDFCLTGSDCRFLGSGHIYTSPLVPYIIAGTTSEGSITIGANCWLGANVTVLEDVSIGHGSIVGTGALVIKSVPPFSMVVGSPARVIKRFDFQNKVWISLEEYSEDKDKDLLDEAEYLEILNQKKIGMSSFKVAAASRFGDL